MRPTGGYRGDELVSARFVQRPYLLYPLLLPQTKLIIGGEAKQHKSFILHSLLWALATGQPAFNLPSFTVPQPVPGILFSQELTETVLQDRWKAHSQGNESFLKNTYCVPKGRYGLDYDETGPLAERRKNLWYEIEHWAGRLGRQPAWIALDPISKFHMKQENKQEEVAGVLQMIDEIQLRTGAAVIFCHHHGVMTQDKATYRSGGGLLRGSSQWHADVDCIMTVGRKGKGKESLEHTINIELRHGEEMPNFVVGMKKPSLLFEFRRWAEAPNLDEERKELT